MELTDYLAIYGALLSSLVFLWSAKQARPSYRIRLTFATDSAVGGKTRVGVGISVQNPSSHQIHISNVSFFYPFRRPTMWERLTQMMRYKISPFGVGWAHSSLSLHQVDDGCPTSIEPGKSHWIFVSEEDLQKALSDATAPHFRVVVQDALWRNKYSEKFVYPRPPA